MEQMDAFETDTLLNNRKTYYSIREVCEQTGLEPHVLRYWESEFPQLRPKKNRAGNRAYRDKDIETIRLIRHLLYEEQFTIPGAKKRLSEERVQKEPEPQQRHIQPEPEPTDHRTIIVEALDKLRGIHSILAS
jgi:DNA-binding transcriptional MerR regulator